MREKAESREKERAKKEEREVSYMMLQGCVRDVFLSSKRFCKGIRPQGRFWLRKTFFTDYVN